VNTIFGGTTPLRMWEGKNRPKFTAISRNFTFRSRISPERMKISTSGKRRYQLQSLPRSAKKMVNFGPLTTELTRLMFTDPNSTSFKGYISALRGRCRLKFLHALENDQGLLAHTPPGTGVPPPIFNNEHSKIGLKFGVCAPITLVLRGVTPPNYTT